MMVTAVIETFPICRLHQKCLGTTAIEAELAGHARKLDVKLQFLFGSGFSLNPVRMLAKLFHFGVNLPTTLCENKDDAHFFTLNFECHNRYNKLFLCNCENGGIALCNKIIQNGIFVFSLKI